MDPDGKDDDDISSITTEERKKQARAIIQCAVNFPIFHVNPDPRECWRYLSNRFAPNSLARRWEFKKRLHNLRLFKGKKVADFEPRVSDVLWNLLDMGMVTDNRELVAGLLAVVPNKFSAIRSHDIDNLTSDELFSRMRGLESLQAVCGP